MLTLATPIHEEWLRELFPEAFREAEVIFDSALRRVVGRGRRVSRSRAAQRSRPTSPPEQAAALLAREVEAGTCPLKNWDNAVEQWIVRLNLLARMVSGVRAADDRRGGQAAHDRADLPRRDELQGDQGTPGLAGGEVVAAPAQQQLLEQFAPERLELPNGRKAKITYGATGAADHRRAHPGSLRRERNLRIGRGRVPLVIQVLAPNHRPIQITRDLATFWKDTYPKIKQELQRKYPKHEWR